MTKMEIKYLSHLLSSGRSVAHWQAAIQCKRFEDPDVLAIKDSNGITVAQYQLKKGWEPKTDEAKAYILAERLKKGEL